MASERYPWRTNPEHDYYGRSQEQDYGRDYGSGRDYSYSSARDYAAAGYDEDRGYGRDRDAFSDYGPRGRWGGNRDYHGGRRYGSDYDRGYAAPYAGSYMSDGRRELDYGRNRGLYDEDRDYRRGSWTRTRGYGRPPQGYDYQERGFMDRAGDELRSWFGDEEAERRREMDRRYDERYRSAHDEHYADWRRRRIAELDRDYDEYRTENATKFENDFNNWRTERQGQRSSLARVTEHMEVVGSDGEHVGTVDYVRGDRLVLTKSDADAGGRHHSIPSRWIASVDDRVTIRKTADEAHREWRDEERNQAFFRSEEEDRTTERPEARHRLNRSFSGTY